MEWAIRLTSLNAPVKKHTQDYMTEYLLRKDGHALHKFEIDTTRQWEENFYYTKQRLPTLETMAQQMIFSNREQVEVLIEKLVSEKFSSQSKC